MTFNPIPIPNPNKHAEGIVQVCEPNNESNSQNEWIMVCRDSVVPLDRDGVSHAACRQFGFIGAAAVKEPLE